MLNIDKTLEGLLLWSDVRSSETKIVQIIVWVLIKIPHLRTYALESRFSQPNWFQGASWFKRGWALPQSWCLLKKSDLSSWNSMFRVIKRCFPSRNHSENYRFFLGFLGFWKTSVFTCELLLLQVGLRQSAGWKRSPADVAFNSKKKKCEIDQ